MIKSRGALLLRVEMTCKQIAPLLRANEVGDREYSRSKACLACNDPV
jgi:hypothetical protein